MDSQGLGREAPTDALDVLPPPLCPDGPGRGTQPPLSLHGPFFVAGRWRQCPLLQGVLPLAQGTSQHLASLAARGWRSPEPGRVGD